MSATQAEACSYMAPLNKVTCGYINFIDWRHGHLNGFSTNQIFWFYWLSEGKSIEHSIVKIIVIKKIGALHIEMMS